MPHVKLTLSPLQNAITADGRVITGRDKWACAFLALLVSHQERHLTFDTLNRALLQLGQGRALARAQVARLVAHARVLFDGAVGDGAFDQRFVVQPRSVTVGPWAWRAAPGDEVQIVAPDALLHTGIFGGADARAGQTGGGGAVGTPEAVCVLVDARPSRLHGWLVALAHADKFAMAGDHADAAAAFGRLLSTPGMTPDGRALVLLRQARSLKRCGDIAGARDALREVLALANAAGGVGMAATAGSALAAARFMAEFQLLRVDYDEAPARGYLRVANALQECAPPAAMPYGVAEWHNLAGITQRRIANAAWLEAGAAGAGSALRLEREAAAHAAADCAWRHLCAAIYWALSFQDFDNVQNFIVNLGMHCAAMHNIGMAAGIEDAFAFYDLSLAYASNFACGEDTAWEHVVLGNLWLDYPHLRERFETTPTLAGLTDNRGRPGHDAFFAAIVEVARRKGDARQFALALECSFRYGEQQQRTALKATAAAELKRLFRSNRLLRTELDREDMPAIRRMLAWNSRRPPAEKRRPAQPTSGADAC